MLYQEREAYIKRELEKKSFVKTMDLVNIMDVSIDTIRRDLKKMEDKGLLKCARGGATSIDNITVISTFHEREIKNIELKREAAKKAIMMIKENSTIALNSGTTNTILASEMLSLKFPFTVITNNLSVIQILKSSPFIDVICIGGFLDKKENSFYGQSCENEFRLYNPDVAFLSINAVSLENGFSDFRYHDFPIINTLVNKSHQCIAIMDSTKFGKKSKKNILKLNDIHLLISDHLVNELQKKSFKEKGLKII